jgi:hypothetical protein
MSGCIMTSFNHGQFQGWGLTVAYTGTPGSLERATVVLTAPNRRADDMLSSGLAVSREVDEYDEIVEAITAGSGPALERLAAWLIDSMRAAVAHPHLFWLPLPAYVVPLWAALVDRADASAADWFTRYPDGTRPHFEIVGKMLYLHDTDTLVTV